MTTTTKREQYAALVSARKRCRLCVGLRNPADAELAAFDSDEIGPWSRLHGDLDADLMIIGQDWGGVRYYAVNQGLDDLRNPTMRTLERLLRGIGLDISLAEYGAGARGVFLTNAVLCLKKGGLQAPVEWQWFENCGSHFLRRQIEIVAPRVAVALGQKAYEAVLGAFGLQVGPFRRAVENELGTPLPNGSRLLAVYHCGQRILNTHRPFEQQQREWRRVAKALGQQQRAESRPATTQSRH
ncbi:MAG TPA: uracil-DNA glycosylase family protein [Gemmataceae bacterium]|nr:uracil-DNA glycosylase family protein [Gemmataceae bacterium]